MPLTGAEVEAAFVQAAHEQVNGAPFDWPRVAEIINARLADQGYARRGAFLLGERP